MLKGNIKLWYDEAGTSPVNSLVFSSDDLPITLWVEAKETSITLKDIEILATVGGELNDQVRATGVWCEFVNKYNAGYIPDPELICESNLASFIISLIDNEGNIYGLGYCPSSFSSNPAYGGYTIEFDDNEIAQLYNSANLVSSSNKANGSWELNESLIIDTSNLNSGMYFIKVTAENGSIQILKFIKS